jgi:hypothetical protein
MDNHVIRNYTFYRVKIPIASSSTLYKWKRAIIKNVRSTVKLEYKLHWIPTKSTSYCGRKYSSANQTAFKKIHFHRLEGLVAEELPPKVFLAPENGCQSSFFFFFFKKKREINS